MTRTFVFGAITLGASVFCLLGAFGAGADSLGLMLVDFGVPGEFSNNVSRMISGALLSGAIILMVIGSDSDIDGKNITDKDFVAAKEAIERPAMKSSDLREI